jgi:hypothetical protein
MMQMMLIASHWIAPAQRVHGLINLCAHLGHVTVIQLIFCYSSYFRVTTIALLPHATHYFPGIATGRNYQQESTCRMEGCSV